MSSNEMHDSVGTGSDNVIMCMSVVKAIKASSVGVGTMKPFGER